jgi:hypothetical protein
VPIKHRVGVGAGIEQATNAFAGYGQGAAGYGKRFAVFTRTDSGRTAPNYSYLLGDLSSGVLSNLYYPRANRGASLMFTNAAVGLAGRIAGNIIREFSKGATTNVPGSRKK